MYFIAVRWQTNCLGLRRVTGGRERSIQQSMATPNAGLAMNKIRRIFDYLVWGRLGVVEAKSVGHRARAHVAHMLARARLILCAVAAKPRARCLNSAP